MPSARRTQQRISSSFSFEITLLSYFLLPYWSFSAKSGNRFVTYTTSKGVTHELQFDGEEPWFTQKDLADMFGVTVPTINSHIQAFRADGELDESTIRDFDIVRQEGNRQVTREPPLIYKLVEE